MRDGCPDHDVANPELAKKDEVAMLGKAEKQVNAEANKEVGLSEAVRSFQHTQVAIGRFKE
jgi:hypothetical protein